jgi:hypothetical protein
VTADGDAPLTTEIFDAESDYLSSDAVFGVAPELILRFASGEGDVTTACCRAPSSTTPGSLAELGLTEADVERAVALATVDPYANPAPVTGDGIRTLLLAALRGEDV